MYREQTLLLFDNKKMSLRKIVQLKFLTLKAKQKENANKPSSCKYLTIIQQTCEIARNITWYLAHEAVVPWVG